MGKWPPGHRYRYPPAGSSQSGGWTREDCAQVILAEGLPLPVKSACWTCPASKRDEVDWLAATHPDLAEAAIEMEGRAHARGPRVSVADGPGRIPRPWQSKASPRDGRHPWAGGKPMIPRSARRETRIPILVLPAIAALQAMPPETRDALAGVLVDLATDCGGGADYAWRRHKTHMAAHWKAVAVYARHTARAIPPAIRRR